MGERMHRVVDAKALPRFGAGRGEGLRGRSNGLVDLSDAPAALPRRSRAPHRNRTSRHRRRNTSGPLPRAIKDPALAVPDRAIHPEELLAPT